MRYLIIISTIVLVALAGPLATQSRAVEAHHPEKTAKAKASKATKAKQQKRKPAAKSEKAKQSKIAPGVRPWRA